MIGTIDKVEAKTGKSGKNYFKVTINGKTGNSFDEHFFNSQGKTFEVEETQQGEYTNFKFIKEVNGQPKPNTPQPKTSANDIKVLLIPKSIELAIGIVGLKSQVDREATKGKDIFLIADSLLEHMMKKALE